MLHANIPQELTSRALFQTLTRKKYQRVAQIITSQRMLHTQTIKMSTRAICSCHFISFRLWPTTGASCQASLEFLFDCLRPREDRGKLADVGSLAVGSGLDVGGGGGLMLSGMLIFASLCESRPQYQVHSFWKTSSRWPRSRGTGI
jgi:hypothetical protein